MNPLTIIKSSTLPLKKFWKAHDSGILTGVTIVATGLAVVFALQDGPKCERILREKKEEGASNLEKAKAVLPVAGRTMMAVAVAWGATLLNHKRTGDKIAALVEAVQISRSLQEETRKKTVEVVGEEKAEEIDREVKRERAASKPVIMSEVEETGHGNFIFREPMTGKTFRASKDYIMLVMEKWNARLEHAYSDHNDEYEVTMTDIFMSIGLSKCGFADLFAWSARDVDRIDVNLNNTFEYEAPDGSLEPGYIMDFYTKPTLGYNSYTYSKSRNY